MKKAWFVAAASVAVGFMLASSAGAADKKIIAWVPNGASDFWKLAEAGMAKTQTELPDVELQ